MKYLQIALVGMLTSFFFFPTAFTLLPSVNTKIMMAVMGIMISLYKNSAGGGGMVTKPIIELTTYAGLFSLACFISVVYNGTSDYTYATYFISMWIWAIAAYAVCQWIQHVHGEVTFELVVRYLAGMCVAQCLLALEMDGNKGFSSFIDSIFVTGSDYYGQGGRLYGIGCALDPAGVRFSVVLVLLAELIVSDRKSDLRMCLYMIAFTIIIIVGNMIARTTTVGAALALGYIGVSQFTSRGVDKKTWQWFFLTLCIVIPVMVLLYYTNPGTRANLRFGFEGFFSLVEKGRWETNSNNVLKSMVVWPDNLKSWIIGDGYFLSPYATNPYYVGTDSGVFYKNTDIGYCRFIFYCGIIGLSMFSIFFIKVASMCANLFPKRMLCLLFLLIVNFAVWGKVATDNFLVFALLFFTDFDKEEEDTPEIAADVPQDNALVP